MKSAKLADRHGCCTTLRRAHLFFKLIIWNRYIYEKLNVYSMIDAAVLVQIWQKLTTPTQYCCISKFEFFFNSFIMRGSKPQKLHKVYKFWASPKSDKNVSMSPCSVVQLYNIWGKHSPHAYVIKNINNFSLPQLLSVSCTPLDTIEYEILVLFFVRSLF